MFIMIVLISACFSCNQSGIVQTNFTTQEQCERNIKNLEKEFTVLTAKCVKIQ